MFPRREASGTVPKRIDAMRNEEKRMRRITTLMLAAFAAASIASVASAATPGIDARQANQNARIERGVKNGQLTRGEARRLRGGQRRFHRLKRRSMADGRVTPRERMRINRMLNHQSRRIHRLEHNRRHRVA